MKKLTVIIISVFFLVGTAMAQGSREAELARRVSSLEAQVKQLNDRAMASASVGTKTQVQIISGNPASTAPSSGPAAPIHYSNIVGEAKPEDNATVGAQAGANLKNQSGAVVVDPDMLNSYIGTFPSGLRAGLAAGLSSSTVFEISFDSVSLIDGLGNNKNLQSDYVLITQDAYNGPGRLDTGSWAPNTSYYDYIIYNPGAGTIAGVASLSSVAPNLSNCPGYTFYRLVSGHLTDGSSLFLVFSQVANQWSLKTPLLITNTLQISYTALQLTYLVNRAGGAWIYTIYQGSTALSNVSISLDGTTEWDGGTSFAGYARAKFQTWIPMPSASPFYIYYLTGTDGTLGIYLEGLLLNI